MKSFEHCEHVHEKFAFNQLSQQFPDIGGIELYPNFELFDESKKSYLECDLVIIAKNHCAIVELKHWRGEIDVAHNLWYRKGRAALDPHLSNNRKCKVLKSTIEKILPASRQIPFVNSIVVLTHPDSEVSGADTVASLFKQDILPAQMTFEGISGLVSYLKKRRHGKDKKVLSDSEFSQVRAFFDRVSDLPKEEYTDQIPGYKILKDLEHTDNYVSYLATENPPMGDAYYRLRVFGVLSDDPIKKAKQTRSLTELRHLSRHENILQSFRHPNDKNLVVEVSEWLGLETLEQRLANVGQMVWAHASKIALGVAKALSHIHSSDHMLVHRNVSPKSILLNSDNVPQLTDFDLVYDPTEEHTVFVDPSKTYQPYLAPEVRVGGADVKSDVYSWGITFFTMLAGKPPKTRDKGILREGLTDQLLGELPADVPSELNSLLKDVMQFNVGDRPESTEVVDRLSKILQPEELFQPQMTSNTWVLEELLAEGATSEVYLGDCLGERAALKLYRHEVPKDLCVHERAMLSAAAGTCVPKYKFFMQWADGRWCLAMEHITGRKLRDFIESHTFPSLDGFRDIASQLLDTLTLMHPIADSEEREGIIHNDINPNNILYDEQAQQAYLIDFGAASWPGPVTYRGTQGYVHPSLVSAGELEALPSGDIYSLGVTLWEWIVGDRLSKNSKYSDIALEGCSESQKKRLFEWLSKCWGREKESYESAGQALKGFQSIWDEENLVMDVDVEKVIVPEVEVFGDEEKCSAAPFVDYLNSIHNVTASNANALAEAQAVNPYFVDIYEPFDLVDDICEYLSGTDPVVIVLTGHAGDGKSTIALDALKKLKRLPEGKILDAPPKEIEPVKLDEGHCVKIVKDMSELSADDRLRKLKESLESTEEESVSWLIVSNTGPLLSSFSGMYEGQKEQLGIESEILRVLNQPIESTISSEEHCLEGFSKPVLLVNMAKLDNVEIATRVLKRVVSHYCWEGCAECEAGDSCHIALNVKALQEVGDLGLERVRWLYSRLTSYGQRMTLRQMSSHLAFSLTSGFSCAQIRQKKNKFASLSERDSLFSSRLFSNAFLGGDESKKSPALDCLYCIQLLKAYHFGVNSSPQFERSMLNGNLADWATVPASLSSSVEFLLNKFSRSENGDMRQRLRRLVYMFAEIKSDLSDASGNYINHFLNSEKLVSLDGWVAKGAIDLSGAQKRELLNSTLGVLLEEYSGFSVGQYGDISKLYVTLKRSDKDVYQPAQLVLAEFSFDEFDLVFDVKKKIPKLIHKRHKDESGLELSLPLLDYITSRGTGNVDCGLDPIYANQIDYFRSQLLAMKNDEYQDEDSGIIKLVRAGIEGDVSTYSYEIATNGKCLEGI